MQACSLSNNSTKVSGVILKDAKMKSSPHVCWLEEGDLILKGFIEETIERGWQRWAKVDFLGWDYCGSYDQPTQKSMLKIQTIHPDCIGDTCENNSPAWSYVPFIPDRGPNMAIYLNVIMKQLKIEHKEITDLNQLNDYSKNYIRHIALHEFGHALGFEHEHRRNDFDLKTCKYSSSLAAEEQIKALDKAEYNFLTVYDENSVMNYCNENPELSPLDIEAVQKLYGVREVHRTNHPNTANDGELSQPETKMELLSFCSHAKNISDDYIVYSRILYNYEIAQPGSPIFTSLSDVGTSKYTRIDNGKAKIGGCAYLKGKVFLCVDTKELYKNNFKMGWIESWPHHAQSGYNIASRESFSGIHDYCLANPKLRKSYIENRGVDP